MFYLEVKRFFKVINEKKLENATGKSKSTIYRYAEDPLEEDKNRRGVSMPVDYLIQIVTSSHLPKNKSVKLLEYLCEVCGYELQNKSIEDVESENKQAKKLSIAYSLFNAKNWQALADERITSKEACELMPLAEQARDELTKYIGSLRKIIKASRVSGVKNG